MNDIIIGVDRTLTDIGELAKWNKKRLRWIITHNNSTITRQHIIDLEMVIVSSERVIKVDGEFRSKSMISFGFNQEFQISNRLKGKIVQDGMTFELYVNGQSFTSLSKKEYGYEPPKLQVSFYQPKNQQKQTNSIKPLNNPYVFKQQEKKQVKVQSPVQPQKIIKQIVIKQPQKTEDALKNAQDQLMKIMIEEKRKKKQLQNKMNNQ